MSESADKSPESMALLIWSDQYAVGHFQIDSQHQQLINIINLLHDAMRAGGALNQMQEVARRLLDYTRYHFAFEESLMKAQGYPGFAEHQRSHRELEGQVRQYAEELAAGKVTTTIKTMAFLKEWLVTHILEADKQFATYVAKPRVA